MRVGYARVSTDEQSLNLQIDALRAAGCRKIYKEKVSGKTRKPPKLSRAIETLNAGDHIVVWRLDRLGRDFRNMVDIADELRAKDVHIISLTEGVDTATSIGEVVYRIICVFADHERKNIVERTVAGLAAAKARGVKLGRRPKLTPHQIAEAQRFLDGGQSAKVVAGRLAVGRSTLYRNLNGGRRRADRYLDLDRPEQR